MTDALDAYLDEDPWRDGPESVSSNVTEYWVTDLLSATRALGRVGRIDREINKIEDAANERIDQIRAWQNDECDRLQQRRAYYETLLAHYHASVLDDDPRAKTIKLSNGSLVARKQAPNIDIPDPDALLTRLRLEGLTVYIRTKHEIDRAGLKQAVLKDGEMVDGVFVVPGEVKFSVAPN